MIRPPLLALFLACCVVAAGCGGGGEETSEATVENEAARTNAQKILSRVRTQIDRHRYNRALRLVERAARADSTYAWVPYFRGEVYRGIGQPERARNQYLRALDLDDGHPEARVRLGDLAADDERYAEALEWYDRQWSLVQDQLERRGWTYDDLPRTSRMATQMRTVPIRRARMHAQTGATARAREILHDALDRDSTHAAAHYYISQIHEEEGEIAAALERARRAARLAPNSAEYRYALGRLLVETGAPEEAISHLKRVLGERPRHVGAHYNLGQAYIRTGRAEEGRQFVTRSDSLRALQQRIAQARVTARGQRDNPTRWLELAHLLRRAEQSDEAARAYRTVLALDSTNAEARRYLEQLKDES